jgi:hypothetical protein
MQIFVWLFGALVGFMVWLAQKKVERQTKIYDDAVTALICYQNEGSDYELQAQHFRISKKNRRTGPYLTKETVTLMGRSIALIPEYFQDVADKFIKQGFGSKEYGSIK